MRWEVPWEIPSAQRSVIRTALLVLGLALGLALALASATALALPWDLTEGREQFNGHILRQGSNEAGRIVIGTPDRCGGGRKGIEKREIKSPAKTVMG